MRFAAGCSTPPPASPADDPEPLEPEVTEPEVDEPAVDEPEATEAGGSDQTSDTEDHCAGAAKKKCQVMQGCAWSDQGKGACIPHRE